MDQKSLPTKQQFKLLTCTKQLKPSMCRLMPVRGSRPVSWHHSTGQHHGTEQLQLHCGISLCIQCTSLTPLLLFGACGLQLTFRTYVQDAGEPNGNSDHLAAKFRDELMPSRGKLHRERSPLISISRVCGLG